MKFLYLIFYACLSLQFLDVETNLAHGVLFPLSVDYSVVMCGIWRRLSVTYCCALRLWSQIRVTYWSCWFPDLLTLSCCAGVGCLEPERWLHTYKMDI